jgi:hypothetical protein
MQNNRECILKAQQQDTVIVIGDNTATTTTTTTTNHRRDNYNNRDRGYQTKHQESSLSRSSSRDIRNGERTVAGRLAFVGIKIEKRRMNECY